ncbi:MAG: hypothetical protein ACTHN5_00805 [Phycisphaerae bacterium]
MGCCLFAVIGAIWPRIALVFLYFFTVIPHQVFKTTLWPLLGFLFVPTTTLAYELCLFYIGPVENIWCLLIILLAFLHDLTQLGVARRPARK